MADDDSVDVKIKGMTENIANVKSGLSERVSNLVHDSENYEPTTTPVSSNFNALSKLKDAKAFFSSNIFASIGWVVCFIIFNIVMLIAIRPNFIKYKKINKDGSESMKISITKLITSILVIFVVSSLFYFVYSCYGEDITKYFSNHYFEKHKSSSINNEL